MTRGRKPTASIDEAKKFAEKMGYRWQTNEHPDLGYDLFIFKPQMASVVRVRQTLYTINPDTFYEDLIADDLREVRALPFPPGIIREIWLRTRHERAWRRLRVLPTVVSEIDWWGPDNYTNPHSR